MTRADNLFFRPIDQVERRFRRWEETILWTMRSSKILGERFCNPVLYWTVPLIADESSNTTGDADLRWQ